MKKWEVDFHILGSSTLGGTDWTANGFYINDDGLTVKLDNNYNNYQIDAKSAGKDFTLTVNTLKYAKEIAPGCTAINQNDYLGSLYFYNAHGYDNDHDYQVKVCLKPDNIP